MPTDREREYYRMGFADGIREDFKKAKGEYFGGKDPDRISKPKPRRKLSAWNKFVKANSKKKIFQYANGKLKLKKMGIAFRKKKR
tara:strand:- start:77 stop:331 length:255 start_codon:yes stop_codon:yes gene_type:complete